MIYGKKIIDNTLKATIAKPLGIAQKLREHTYKLRPALEKKGICKNATGRNIPKNNYLCIVTATILVI